ncbi:MAG: precorrin-8X methylmutase [Thermodesulfobacteria bacterium]|nr:precorrin-8X methylmutase [Thermodesulfobacteriota bacterium]
MILAPQAIEAESFRLIDEAFRKEGLSFPEEVLPLVKRAVHATGDVSLARDFVFHPEAVKKGVAALRAGANLFCDVKMVASGINRKALCRLGGELFCFIDDPKVVQEAKERGLTRAYVAMEKALAFSGEKIIVVGNAPTALLPVLEAMEKGHPPALVIGVPVGFVGAAAYKEELSRKTSPFITLRGPRGGSPIAAALVNALLKLALQDEASAAV